MRYLVFCLMVLFSFILASSEWRIVIVESYSGQPGGANSSIVNIKDVAADALTPAAGFSNQSLRGSAGRMDFAIDSGKVFAHISSPSGVKLRASATEQSPVLEILGTSQSVEVVGFADQDWVMVRSENRRVGFVAARYIVVEQQDGASVFAATPSEFATRSQELPTLATRPTGTDARFALIQESKANYSGNCPCPDDRKSNGDLCGGNSAYSRKNGYAPLCYPNDIPDDMVIDWLESRTN